MPHVLLLLACAGSAPTTPVPTDTDVPTGPGDTDTGVVVSTADTAPPEPIPVVDCTSLPAGPFVRNVLVAPRAYHGLAFDELGGLVGGDNTNMVRATSPTDATLWIPNVGQAEQMDYLPDGDLVVAASNAGRIVRVHPDGSSTPLASGIYAYGVEVGPDGMVYTANQNVIHRIDPVAGGAEVFLNTISSPKVVNFSADGTLMYVGTNDGTGNVWEVDLDASFEPVGAPRLLGQTGGSWHDGLGVDACGNVYVNEFWTRSLYMFEPDGTVHTLIEFGDIGSEAYGHGIQWGSGVGPWSDHSIFVPLPYGGNRVAEHVLGIPSKDYNGGVYDVIR